MLIGTSKATRYQLQLLHNRWRSTSLVKCKPHQAGNVLDHILMVPASRTTAADDSLAITGY